jgi:phage head maturation protease
MQLTVTGEGMDIRVDLDTENNAEARALYSAVKRGDMTGMSFMFGVDKDSWEDIESDYPKRTVEHISRVLEVSAVAFPAYPQTSIQVASEGDALDSARASLESARKELEEQRAKQAEDERRTAALERLNNLIKEVKHDEV